MDPTAPHRWEPDPDTETLLRPAQLAPGHYVHRRLDVYPHAGWYRVVRAEWLPQAREYYVQIDRPHELRNDLADHFRLAPHTRIAARTAPAVDTTLLIPVWRRLALLDFGLGCVTDPPLTERSFRGFDSLSELAEQILAGPWRAGTAFHHDGICVVLRDDGGDHWLTLSHDIRASHGPLEDITRRGDLPALWRAVRPEPHPRTPRPTLITASDHAVALWTHGDATARVWLVDDAEDHRGPEPDLRPPVPPGTPFRPDELHRFLGTTIRPNPTTPPTA